MNATLLSFIPPPVHPAPLSRRDPPLFCNSPSKHTEPGRTGPRNTCGGGGGGKRVNCLFFSPKKPQASFRLTARAVRTSTIRLRTQHPRDPCRHPPRSRGGAAPRPRPSHPSGGLLPSRVPLGPGPPCRPVPSPRSELPGPGVAYLPDAGDGLVVGGAVRRHHLKQEAGNEQRGRARRSTQRRGSPPSNKGLVPPPPPAPGRAAART